MHNYRLSQSLKHSKDYHNLLDNVIENELSTNEKPNNELLWVQMGSQLEIEGVPNHQISTIIRKDIEDRLYEKEFKDYMPRQEYRWHSGYYWRVMKKHNWTNPEMARNVKDDPLGDQDNSSIYTQNKEMNLLCDDIISLCKTIKEKANESDELTETFGKKEMREFYRQRKGFIKNCMNAINSKTKIPENTELLLLECLATVLGNTHRCVEVFQEKILLLMKEEGKFLTIKQATKFQNGGKQSKLEILKPISRDTALFANYTGVQCTCGSWRVRQKPDSQKLECYDCEKEMPKQHISKCNVCQIPLYKERLQYIVKNKKCQNCESHVDLPKELISYAKS